MQDQELRDQFDEWAEPLRATSAPAVAALRSRIRRRMAKIAAAAASALAVVGLVAGLLVAGNLAGGRTPKRPAPQAQSSAKYPAPPGQPYLFVNNSATFPNQGDARPVPAELRNAATGKVVKVLRPVGHGTSFTAAAVAPGDRAFVLAQQDTDGTLSFAEIRISASGKAGPLRLVQQVGHACVAIGTCVPALSLPAGTQAENMTVNAAVTRLSFFAAATNGVSGSLVVYNLQTGALIGSWPVRGSNDFAISQFLGSGDELVVTDGNVKHGQNRLVDASAPFRPGSSLLADSRPDVASADGVPGSFTQDGNVWVNAGPSKLSSAGQPSGPELLVEDSAASGKTIRKIPIGPSTAISGPYFCGVLWASANGNEVLAQCGSRQLKIVGPVPPGVCLPSKCAGHVTPIRLPWLLPANTEFGINTFAW